MRARRRLPVWVVLGVAVGAAALLAWLPLPFLVMEPGQVFDLSHMLRVPATTATAGGEVEVACPGVGLVTVAARPARGWEVAVAAFHPWQEIAPTAALPLPVEQYVEAERLLFRESVCFAAAAALTLVGKPLKPADTDAHPGSSTVGQPAGPGVEEPGGVGVGQPAGGEVGEPAGGEVGEPAGEAVIVLWVTRQSPLYGRIHAGEILQGYPTTFHLRRALREHGQIQVWVGSQPLQLRSDDLRGAGLATVRPALPGFPLALSGEEVGGPSGGLACGLEVLRQLGRLSIPAGLRVAATGTLDASGEVGRTGAVALKARAARAAGVGLFLVPAGQEEEARQAVPDLKVAGVSSLAEAVALLAPRR